MFANWTFLTLDCAGSEIIGASLDPNTPEILSFARGAPFCAEDNLAARRVYEKAGFSVVLQNRSYLLEPRATAACSPDYA